jgi:hypothetical protein
MKVETGDGVYQAYPDSFIPMYDIVEHPKASCAIKVFLTCQ